MTPSDLPEQGDPADRQPSVEAVRVVAEVVGEKIHWIHDPIRAEDPGENG